MALAITGAVLESCYPGFPRYLGKEQCEFGPFIVL